MSFFDEIFWPEWPNKQNKKQAGRACERALRRGVDAVDIMAGVKRYKAGKEDWKAWMHATTFFNGDRWEDEYPEPEEDYGFVMQGGEKHNLTAFVANGIWRDAWGVKPESWAAAKARLDEINAPRHGLKVVS